MGVCAWARVSAAPRHSWLGCWGVCVFVCALRLYPATPGWGVRCGCVCLGSVFVCAPPLLAGVCGVGVCAWARFSAAPRHSWLGCAVWVCVLGLGFRLRPATPGLGVVVCEFVCALRLYPPTPGWGVRCGCVCLGSVFGCALPLLDRPCGVEGCAWARVSAAPRHSWLGVGVCVCLCVGSACPPPLLPEVCGVGVCAWARISPAPRHSWIGCWGVRVYVRAPLVPRHSWLECAVWACVLGLGFRLRPATPGWGVRCGCVCFGSGFGCAPPLLAGVLGCVCACVCAPLVPPHSWLGCPVWVCVLGLVFWLGPASPGWGVGVCVFVCALRLYPTTPGWGVPALARVLDAPRHSWLGCLGVRVIVCALRLYPATPGWGVRCACVCSGSGFGCTPPLLAGVLGFVCVCVHAPLVPPHSWLGCAVWVCVLGLVFWLGPASPGWGVGVCVFVCALRLYPTAPGWGVRALARVLVAPRHSWPGCLGVRVIVCALRLYPATPGWVVRCGCVCSGSGLGCAPPLLAGVLGFVCVCVRAPLVPRHSWLGCAV